MPPFRPVDAALAGPAALGILLPPGRRTLVVLRPRALPVDLLWTQTTREGVPSAAFRQLARSDAATEAHQLGRALLRCAAQGVAEVGPVAAPEGVGFWLSVRIEAYTLVACARDPGEPYRPRIYAAAEEAAAAGAALRSALCPAADAECELYTNARHFGP